MPSRWSSGTMVAGKMRCRPFYCVSYQSHKAPPDSGGKKSKVQQVVPESRPGITQPRLEGPM